MGTIADKLTYLDETREKILTETNRLGVGLTEQDKFRDYAKGLHDGYVDILNNGTDTLYDNMEKVSGSGSRITLENTEEAPMRSDLEGDTYQETTTGKNLLGLLPNQSVEVNGVTISTTEEGYLKLNGTATANINKSYNWAVGSSTYTSQAYTLSITYVSGTLSNSVVINTRSGSTTTDISNQFNPSSLYTNTSGNSTTFTPSGSGYITGIQIIASSGHVFNNFIVKMQIAKGTDTTYEEYTGGQPSPNPDYPREINVVSGRQEVSVVGKNLLNLFLQRSQGFTRTVNGITETYNNDGSITYNGTSTSMTDLYITTDTYGSSKNNILLDSGKSYTLSLVGNTNNNIQIFIGYGNSAYNTSTTRTFTPTTNISWVFIRINNGTTLENFTICPQLEKGSTASEYEAYKEQSYEINLGKNLFDYTKIDYIANGTHNEGVITQTGINCYFYFNNGAISVNSGETIYFSADIKLNDNSTGTFSNINDNVNGGTTRILQPILSTTYQKYQTSFKYNSDTKINKMLIQILNLSGTAEISNIMISKSSNINYTPYKTPIELCKINTYKDMIFRSKGVNLFKNGTTYTPSAVAWYDQNGNIANGVSDLQNNDNYIDLKANQTYTFSVINKTNIAQAQCVYISNNNIQLLTNISLTSSTTFTPTTDLRVWVRTKNAASGISTLFIGQLNEGNQALPYEPYNSKGKWLLHKEIGKVVLNGASSESWVKRTDISTTNTSCFRIGQSNVINNQPVLSNNFECLNSVVDSEHFRYSSSTNDYAFQLFINKSRLGSDDTTGLKTWLSTHNTIVYYVLATPTTTEITDTELISQLEEFYNAKSNKDVTYISVTSEDLPAILNVIAIKKYE